MCAVGKKPNDLKFVFCLIHATPSNYHHHACLLTCIEHIRWNMLEACVNACWADSSLFKRGYIYNWDRKYRPLPLLWHLPWLCACDDCTIICCRLHIKHIHIYPGVHYGPMVVLVCLHIALPHYYNKADAYEGIEFLKCLLCTRCRVSKVKSILSIIFHAIYWAVCIQLAHFYYDKFENICTLMSYSHN